MKEYELDIKMKIPKISNLVFNVVMQTTMATFEDFNYESNEYYVFEEYEKSQREKFGNIIEKWAKESDAEKKILDYILLEKDNLGLNDKQVKLECTINDLFQELEGLLMIETLEIKEEWKEVLFSNYKNETERLKNEVSSIRIEKMKIEDNLAKEILAAKKIKDEKNILIEKNLHLNESIHGLKENINKQLKKENQYKNNISQLEEELLIIKRNGTANDKFKIELDKAAVRIDQKNIENKELNSIISKYKKEIYEYENKFKRFEEENKFYLNLLEKAKESKKEDECERKQKNNTISNLEEEIIKLKASIKSKDNLIYAHNSEIGNKENEIQRLKNKIEHLECENVRRNKERISFEEFYNEYSSMFVEVKKYLFNIAGKEKMIEGLRITEICQQLNDINKSIKNSQGCEDAEIKMETLIEGINKLNLMFKRNNLDYGLNELMHKMKMLKEKIS